METLENQKRILFIQTAFLGDVILSLPALEVLKNNLPDYKIDTLCNPTTSEIFKSSPFVDDVLILDKRKTHKSIFSLIKFAKEIRKKKYSRIYSAHRSFRTSLLVLLSEVKETYGFSNSAFNFVYKNLLDYNKNHHEVRRNLELVVFPEKFENWEILPKLNIDDDTKFKLSELLKDFPEKKKIAIAPGSIWATKRYPDYKFSNIIEEFINYDYQIFLIGSKSDKHLCESIANNRKNVTNFAGDFSIVETVELLNNCDLLISNDSAPTHMGMIADIPVITIYCSTVPEFGFYPYNKFSQSVSLTELDCKPCGIHGYKECPLGHFKCGNDLEEKLIINIALEILTKK